MVVGPTDMPPHQTCKTQIPNLNSGHCRLHNMEATTPTTAPPTTTIPTFIQFPMDKVISYKPTSDLISYNWENTLDVLTHLLLHPDDRDELRNEACRRSPMLPHDYPLHHPLLHRLIKINSFDTDYQLVQRIKRWIIRNTVARDSEIPIVVRIEPLIIRDPFGLVQNREELRQTLLYKYPYPSEVTILPVGVRATHLHPPPVTNSRNAYQDSLAYSRDS